jgi:hypothetical protein
MRITVKADVEVRVLDPEPELTEAVMIAAVKQALEEGFSVRVRLGTDLKVARVQSSQSVVRA